MYNLNDLIKETMMKQPLLMLTVLLVTWQISIAAQISSTKSSKWKKKSPQ